PAKVLAAEPLGTWSVASEKRPANRLLTEAPGGSPASSATAGTATPTGPPVTVGASLTGVTISCVATVPALYRVGSPLTETSAAAPLVSGPEESSTSRTVSAGAGPLKSAAGTKRILASGASNRALALET